ncbi:DUF4129 domain-containing protein [Streptomyces sp. PT12]|uniref:DUF4129 domain-containing protein n=1 Tax=Streptomyces sp. PT12 TaxID=1510197 RepID=UPI000DE2938A|nr:DUF4129 domain-containing protein [Streptomyces sp. PT12]RBM21482.1 hypothetical protein DEH69_06255 [Streptomyces sp. PT12]
MAPPWADPPVPPVTVDRVPAQEDAERELSRQIYTEHEPGLVRRIWSWVWDRIFGFLDEAAFRTPGGWFGLLVIAVAVIALLIALRIRLGTVRNARGPAAPGALFTDRPRTADEHRAAAERHAHAAHWTPAVQERLRAIVRSLEERALLDPRPGRTANEAAAEAARPLPGLATELRAAATTFDGVTFGGLPAAPDDYARLAGLDERLARAKPDLAATTTWTAP